MRLMIRQLSAFLLILPLLAMGEATPVRANAVAIDPVQSERDEMLSLATLAMVYKDWQSATTPAKKKRGHNIGSILADKNSRPVFWARNSVTVRDDSSQHGEVRLIQAFLNCPGIGRYMTGYSVYTSLEPCAMCTGMMAMTDVTRVVFTQVDPEFGGVIKALDDINFPRRFEHGTPTELKQKRDLDAGWERYKRDRPGENVAITDYLLTDEAKNIYASALPDLESYQVKFPENQVVKGDILKFMKTVKQETFNKAMLRQCPKLPRVTVQDHLHGLLYDVQEAFAH